MSAFFCRSSGEVLCVPSLTNVLFGVILVITVHYPLVAPKVHTPVP